MPPAALPTPTDLDRELGFTEVWRRGFRGAGVGVALVDTGIADVELLLSEFILETHDFAEDHGTAEAPPHAAKMARCIRNIAPEARLVSFKVFPNAPRFLWFRQNALVRRAITRAMDVCADTYPHLRVANLSLAVPRGRFHRCTPRMPCELCQAVNCAHDAGVVVVSAAGNTGPRPDTIECPGLARGAITVGAYLNRASDAYYREHGADDNFGTSFSSAYVTAGIALLLSARPDAKPEEIRAALTSTARPIAGEPRNAQGAGGAYLPAALEALIGPPAEAFEEACRQLYYLAGNGDAQRENNRTVTSPLDLALRYVELAMLRTGKQAEAAKVLGDIRGWIVPGRLPMFETRIDELQKRATTAERP